MFRMMIADDDAIIRRGLVKTVRWEDYGIEIIGIASDGAEAYELLKEKKPDLLLTDIKMPLMDGIELMKKIRIQYPDIQVILLTAYEDFDYAKEAVKNRACDYLLKPLAREELLEAVLKAKAQSGKEKNEKHQLMKSMPMIKKQFFHDVTAGYYPEDAIRKNTEELKLRLCPAKLAVLDLLILDYFEQNKELSGELLKYAVYNVIEELSESVEHAEVFQGNEDHLYVIISHTERSWPLEDEARSFAETILNTLKTVLNVDTAVGIGNTYTGFRHIVDSCMEAFTALKYRHLSENTVYSAYQDTKIPVSVHSAELGELNKKIIQSTMFGKREEALQLLQECRQKAAGSKEMTIGNLRLWCIGLAAQFYQEMGSLSYAESNDDYYEFCNKICKLSDITQIFQSIAQLIVMICNAMNEKQCDSKTTLAQKAVLYIKQNYANSELSLNAVSAELHVSSVYLSILFKQIQQVTFSDFLFDIRMEAAKSLAEHTNLKAYEIGERIGYHNANYFSCLFKKKFGVSVSEYKKEK